ncbi:MAG: hypothetical protein OXJ52_01980 [Oligoflexia bacterium]|nr:hypothetical protein [Oligoflexia bacterium]
MIPKPFIDICEFLKESPPNLSLSGNARLDSKTSENSVTSQIINSDLRNTYQINSPNIGSGKKVDNNWYDIKVEDLYCDIKISELKSSDNTGATRHIFYLLTGEEPPKTSHNIFEKMKGSEKPCELRDFYYLIVNKDKPADCFIVSLKGFKKVNPNPRNQPFQCNWNENRGITQRNWREAKEYLLSKWAVSIKKQIALAKEGMPKHYPEFF